MPPTAWVGRPSPIERHSLKPLLSSATHTPPSPTAAYRRRLVGSKAKSDGRPLTSASPSPLTSPYRGPSAISGPCPAGVHVPALPGRVLDALAICSWVRTAAAYAPVRG